MAQVIAAPGPDARNVLGRTARVLDPVADMRQSIGETLSTLGCVRVQGVGKTHDAWATLRQSRVDALFLDWSEETDAPAFVHALRAEDGALRFLPAVVMTAYRAPHHLATMRDAGADDVIIRPFPPEAVASRWNAIWARPRLFIASGQYFGPDRRRHRARWSLAERRHHQNRSGADRRLLCLPWNGRERRQGYPGFIPLERRAALRE